jgi:hypothetical protein
MMIHSDELVDFGACLKRHGCNPGDFKAELTGQEYPPAGVVGPVYEQVTVICLPTRTRRSYAAGHVSSWISDFEEDLKAGQFRRV